jgi:hypothetical protein
MFHLDYKTECVLLLVEKKNGFGMPLAVLVEMCRCHGTCSLCPLLWLLAVVASLVYASLCLGAD